jgi:hypothetical protein
LPGKGSRGGGGRGWRFNQVASHLEIEKHNDITQTILIGMLIEFQNTAPTYTARALQIMKMLKARGYEPRIKYSNVLKDGTPI